MSDSVKCNKCGAECFWDTNRHGKRYLAQWNRHEYTNGTGSWKQPHYCQATPEQAAEYRAGLQREKDEQEQRRLAALANGEIVVGQIVKVYRGRKVPQGTIGVVFWVADKADRFDTWKIGIKSADGAKHFLAINNVDFYFEGADELNEKQVADSKAEAKANRKARKALVVSRGEVEI